MRRTPVQERSAARVQQMLDAAAALLDEHAEVTTSSVAKRAGVSVGSLYQFFPDRAAVLQALATRSFERFAERLQTALDEQAPADLRSAVHVVISTYVAFTRDEPGMRTLSFGGPVDRRMLSPDEDNNAVVAEALGQVLAGVVPDLRLGPELRLALRIAVEAADAVLELAFRRDPAGDPQVVAQTEQLLVAYLEPYVR